MRLEQLFMQLNHFLQGNTVFEKRAAISILLEILMIFSRNDLKSELLKEMDRQIKIAKCQPTCRIFCNNLRNEFY